MAKLLLSFVVVCLQAHVCQVGLNSVLAALKNHPSDTDIQAKGLVVLGVLGQVLPLAILCMQDMPCISHIFVFHSAGLWSSHSLNLEA